MKDLFDEVKGSEGSETTRAMDRYFDQASAVISKVADSQRETLIKSAEAIAQTIEDGGLIYIFGTGHSHMLAEEAFYRAGGLVSVSPILDSGLMLHESAIRSSKVERLSGYAEILAEDYGLTSPGLLIVASNSGRNCVPVEMAQAAKSRGLWVIAITSREHSSATQPRPPATQKLSDVADLVLDNGAPMGDACVKIDGIEQAVGPLSTIGGIALINALFVEACALLVQKGHVPDVIVSSNIDGVDERNRQLFERLQGRIRHL